MQLAFHLSRKILLLFIVVFLSCSNDESTIRKRNVVSIAEIKEDEKDTLIYRTHGKLPDFYDNYAEKKIKEKYGIVFQNTDGDVADSVLSFIKVSNDKLFDRLQRKNVHLNEQNMLMEMTDYTILHKKLEDIAFKTSLMESKKKELKSIQYFYTKWHPSSNNSTEYILEIWLAESRPKIDELVYTFKIDSITAKALVKNKEGKWVERLN